MKDYNFDNIRITEEFLKMYFKCDSVEIGDDIDLHYSESQYKIIRYPQQEIFRKGVNPLSPDALTLEYIPQQAMLHIVINPYALAPQYFIFLQELLLKVENSLFQNAVINHYQLQEQIREDKRNELRMKGEIALRILREDYKNEFEFMCEILFLIKVCRKWVHFRTQYDVARISISSFIEISIFDAVEWSEETVDEYDNFLFRFDKNEDLINRVNHQYLILNVQNLPKLI